MAAFGHIKKGAMHRDLGKKPGAPITGADIKKEAKKGPLGAKRANFARMAKRDFKPLAAGGPVPLPTGQPGGFRNAAMKARVNAVGQGQPQGFEHGGVIPDSKPGGFRNAAMKGRG